MTDLLVRGGGHCLCRRGFNRRVLKAIANPHNYCYNNKNQPPHHLTNVR
ncbi:MAG: hypothetical protein JGK29_25050 [Microcoleus sp. PH2017_17_BER_D_A]|nr:hypothetical protein [Microcoleus sp. PH2017_17_BER_D_A]MCC3553022.1 hypothetical protein [Microcoleus sp. PH2017_35_SFW_U_B]